VGSFLLGTLLAIAPGVAAQTDGDGDGLSDDDEIIVYATDPRNPDTDGDGLFDGDEFLVYATNALNPDTDGDGSLDGEEVYFGTNPLVADPLAGERSDGDGDGLYDDDELYIYGTDPLNPDTDRDGSSDGAEVYYGTDPLLQQSSAASS
jgi:hypothetical protein